MARIFLLLSFSLFTFSLLSGTPDSTVVDILRKPDHTSINQLVVESPHKQVDIRIYTLNGEFVPSTLWKSRSERGFRFEAGYDLKQGVYLVRIENQGITRYQKLIIRTS